MKKVFLVFVWVAIGATATFAQKVNDVKVTEVMETCLKVDIGLYSYEKCKVTAPNTKVTTEVTKTCVKTEVGGNIKVGLLKVGASGGAGRCIIEERIIETPVSYEVF